MKKEVVLPPYDGKMGVFNYMRKNNLNSSEEMFLKLNNLSEPPRCCFCGNFCKFKSFIKGYLSHCNSEPCKRKIFLNSFNVKKNNNDLYIKHIKENKDFYKNVSLPFYDEFLSKTIRTIRTIRTIKQFKLLTDNMKCLNEERICLYCKKPYTYNKFLYNKDYCTNKYCCSHYNYKYHDEYKNFSSVPFEIFRLDKEQKTFTNQKLVELLSKYSTEDVILMIKRNAIIYDNHLLKRSCSYHKFSYKYNNIFEEDMFSYCHACGKKYLKYDKVIVDNTLIKKQISSDFSCGTKECYDKCKNLYKRSDGSNLIISSKIKERIKNGLFTPCQTNSWTNNKTNLKFDGLLFRSTWELYFYIHIKNQNLEIEYESKRIPYYDSIKEKQRIYIIDFYIPSKRLLIEVKPICHQNTTNFKDKIFK